MTSSSRSAGLSPAPQADPTSLGDDIHDLIGHKLSLMVLHAGALELSGGPAAERAAMIRELGDAAIAGLHDILARLSDTEAGLPGTRATTTLDELVHESRAAGLPVELRTAVALDHLRPTVAGLLCDVVREALTNVHKHAGPVPTTVTVRTRDGRLVVVDVRNQAPPARRRGAAVGSGRGLHGLWRRLARHGGRLVHESTPDGGFRLCAELPLRASATGGRARATRQGATG